MKQITIGNRLSNSKVTVGEGLETRINLIVGANSPAQVELEQEKIKAGALLGVHTIIDLSTIRLKYPLWMYGRDNHPEIAFGKVAPILVAVENKGEVTPQKLWKEIENSVLGGVDYMTLNLIPRRLSDLEVASNRPFPTTSRQGGVLLNHMMKQRVDNPYNQILNDILALFKEYNVTMHIGSTFRPIGISQAYDRAHAWELRQQMSLFSMIDKFGVQAIVEPMSHQPLKDIGIGISMLRKAHGEYVPFQMLGPIVTELSHDCDQYAAASGAAVAAMHNVGKITTIPPREHVGFPTLEDTMEGIKATKIAVHAGDLCRIPYLMQQDMKIANERGDNKSCNSSSPKSGCNKCLDLCPLLVTFSKTIPDRHDTETHDRLYHEALP
jgi:phosphomethylpyrimidine synthase